MGLFFGTIVREHLNESHSVIRFPLIWPLIDELSVTLSFAWNSYSPKPQIFNERCIHIRDMETLLERTEFPHVPEDPPDERSGAGVLLPTLMDETHKAEEDWLVLANDLANGWTEYLSTFWCRHSANDVCEKKFEYKLKVV